LSCFKNKGWERSQRLIKELNFKENRSQMTGKNTGENLTLNQTEATKNKNKKILGKR